MICLVPSGDGGYGKAKVLDILGNLYGLYTILSSVC